MANYKELLKHINTFIFDYDGVLTDGSVITTNEGDAHRISNVKDGYALQLAHKKGYRVAVISGAKSESMMHRMKALHIEDVFLGVERNRMFTGSTSAQISSDLNRCSTWGMIFLIMR
jgi:3-deoxy-D-manno-octulosonate 8-phosphate phosphatase (KDO 8-P phosphatase)